MKVIFIGIGVCTAKSQAYYDLIIKEGATEERAESWSSYLERNNLLDEFGYYPYTMIAYKGEKAFEQVMRQRMVRNGCL